MSLLEKGLVALVIAGLVGAGLMAVEHHGYNRAVDAYAKQVVKVDAKREAVAAPIVAAHAKKVERIVTVTKTILKDRPVYVKTTDCPLTGGFRVYHDAAANGEVPDASRIPDAAPTPAADAADTVASNYGVCNKIREDLIGLQAWAAKQQTLKD